MQVFAQFTLKNRRWRARKRNNNNPARTRGVRAGRLFWGIRESPCRLVAGQTATTELPNKELFRNVSIGRNVTVATL